MTSVADPPEDAGPSRAEPEEDERQIGIVTRAVSWVVDAVFINLVAIITGIGVELFLSIFPVSSDLSSVLKPIGAAVYAVWAAAYFIAFWSITGQTPGARLMSIRLVTAGRERLKPRRALVRWIGMNLAMIPLFAGYVPIMFGRRGFPDWIARTLVLDTQQLSLAQTRRGALGAARETADGRGGGGRSPRTPGLRSSGSNATGTVAATDSASPANTRQD